MHSSRGSSWTRDQTHVSCIEGKLFTTSITWESQYGHTHIIYMCTYFVMVLSLGHVRLFVTRGPPCPSPSPGVYSNSCPLSRWCHSTISSSVFPFSSCLQPFPASWSFLKSQLFASGGQSIWVSASVPPMNIQDWFLLGLTSLISLQFKRLSRDFSNTTVQKHQFFSAQHSLCYHSHIQHNYWKHYSFDYIDLCQQSNTHNTLSRFVITFLPRSKHLLLSWLQSPSTVILEPKRLKSLTVSMISASICHEMMGGDTMILVIWMLSFKPAFSLSSFTFIKRLFSSSSLSAKRVVSSAYLRLLIFIQAILIPVCDSSSPACYMMYTAYNNKQVDIIPPQHTPFPICNQSIVQCLVLTVASWLAYRFLRRKASCI